MQLAIQAEKMLEYQTETAYPNKLHGISKGVPWLITSYETKKQRIRLKSSRITNSLFGDLPRGDNNKLWEDDRKFRNKFKIFSLVPHYSIVLKFPLGELPRYIDKIH